MICGGFPRVLSFRRFRQESSLKHDQILCLALAIYHEARGELEAERLAVAEVVYNRAVHTDLTICGTIWADNGSQFQWVKSSDTIVPRELAVWQAVQFSALRFARHRPTDSTHGATNFYNPLLCSPEWAHDGQVTVSLRQVFLRIDGRYTRSTGKASGTESDFADRSNGSVASDAVVCWRPIMKQWNMGSVEPFRRRWR